MRWTYGEFVYGVGFVSTVLWAVTRPAPPFNRGGDEARYHTIAFAPAASASANAALVRADHRITFTTDLAGRIRAVAPDGTTAWSFQTATLPRGATRTFLETSGESVLAAGENGHLYDFFRDGRLRASIRVGWRATGSPERIGGIISVPVIDAPDAPVHRVLVEAAEFRIAP